MKPFYHCLITLLLLTSVAMAQQDFSSVYSLKNFDEVNSYYHEIAITPLVNYGFIVGSTKGVLNKNGVWKSDKTAALYSSKEGQAQQDLKFNGLISKMYSSGQISVQNKNIIYFTASNQAATITSKTKHLTYDNEFLCKAEFKNNDWVVTPLVEFSDNQVSYKHPSISRDGRFLYFSSNKVGGMGGFDLYMSYNEDGKWSEPINLGPTVNTDQDETAPYFHQQSGRVFFTSNGHDSFGGTDIFYCFNQGDQWTKATNIGNGINSSANETSFFINDDLSKGFVSSDKKSGKGGFDIYWLIRN